MMKVLDLFSGIGGMSLGLEWTSGFRTVAFCEASSFQQSVLKKHWEEVKCYNDVKELTKKQLIADEITPNVITGGFPCQDISVSGKQAGISAGTRSGLWSECIRLVGEFRPKYAIFENVRNLLSGPNDQPGGWFATILRDLASIGYDAEWHNIPATYVGAWHERHRVWILAYPNEKRLQRSREGPILRQRHLSQQLTRVFAGWPGRPNLPAPRLCSGDDGISRRMVSTQAIGNALLPQIAEIVGNAILEEENFK